MTVQGPTSGTALLDELVDDVRIGDNLVLLGAGSPPLDLLVDRFTAAVGDTTPLVVVNVGRPWDARVPVTAAVLDWSPVVTGRTSPVPDALTPGASFDDALTSLRAADERVGAGAAFVFDRLTAVEDAWGRGRGLDLFLAACPRLYRRRSLALWPVERERHRPSFLRRLQEITQVVVEVDQEEDGDLRLTVRKADGRRAGVVGRSVRAHVVDGDLVATDAPVSAREKLGTVLRDQRLRHGLSQAEVARRVGISPSALSQVERGVRGPSGDTLVRLWEVLGVPFGPEADAPAGYVVARRSGRDRSRLQDGLVGERVVADTRVGEVWHLEVAAGAAGDRAPFAVKGPEVATVVRGVLDVTVGGRTETLHEGDALVATEASVSGWRNPGAEPTEVLWQVGPASSR
ncbi:helix-turn-helix domain-containing protein [Egicoccus sp. AB-alg2]|uniref:helix-turn-helix domain-containing protein n=1 Tax=Egicoccus sp. AB-alg2 TaxID=3242693 RepID=UPI00359DD28C